MLTFDETRPLVMLVSIATFNDGNGNSRKGWLVMDDNGDSHGFVDGYAGGRLHHFPELEGLPKTGVMFMTRSAYGAWKKNSYKSPGTGE